MWMNTIQIESADNTSCHFLNNQRVLVTYTDANQTVSDLGSSCRIIEIVPEQIGANGIAKILNPTVEYALSNLYYHWQKHVLC